MGNYNILAFDGGPSTATSIRYLWQIEKRRPGFLASIDMFAGTSNGSFVSLFLAKEEITAENGLAIIERCIEFDNELLEKVQPSLMGFLRMVSGIGPADRSRPLQQMIDKYFGRSMTLGDLKHDITVVSFRMKLPRGPKVFHNFGDDPDRQALVSDVALSSSAFPVSLPLHNGHIDGGIFANNPSLCAVAQALTETKGRELLPSLDQIYVFSLGGYNHKHNPLLHRLLQKHGSLNWGWLPWMLFPLSPFLFPAVVFYSGEDAIAYQCNQMLKGRSFRLGATSGQNYVKESNDILWHRTHKVCAAADQAAERWAQNANSTDPSFQPNMKDTLSWIDEGWDFGPWTG